MDEQKPTYEEAYAQKQVPVQSYDEVYAKKIDGKKVVEPKKGKDLFEIFMTIVIVLCIFGIVVWITEYSVNAFMTKFSATGGHALALRSDGADTSGDSEIFTDQDKSVEEDEMTADEKAATEALKAKFEELKTDGTMEAAAKAALEEEFQENYGYTYEECGIDPAPYIDKMISSIQDSNYSAYDCKDGKFAVYFDRVAFEPLYLFRDFYYDSQDYFKDNNLGLDSKTKPTEEQKAEIKAIWDKEVGNLKSTFDYFFGYYVTKDGDSWTFDENDIKQDLLYMFGSYTAIYEGFDDIDLENEDLNNTSVTA